MKSLAVSTTYLSIGVVAPYNLTNGQSGLIYAGGKLNDRTVAPPQSLFFWDKKSTALTELQSNLSLPGSRQLCMIVDIQRKGSMIAIGQGGPDANGEYSYNVYLINPEVKNSAKLIATTTPTDLYVNFFWATFDSKTSKLYVLSGHENEPLDSAIYTVDIQTGKTSNLTLVKPTWIFDHIHIDPLSGLLLSVAEGQVNGKQYRALVSTDPVRGNQRFIGVIALSANFESVNGGAVVHGLTQGVIWHTFKNVITDGLELLAIGAKTGNTDYRTQIDIGLNAQRSISGLIFI
jgi:hypothetical protein